MQKSSAMPTLINPAATALAKKYFWKITLLLAVAAAFYAGAEAIIRILSFVLPLPFTAKKALVLALGIPASAYFVLALHSIQLRAAQDLTPRWQDAFPFDARFKEGVRVTFYLSAINVIYTFMPFLLLPLAIIGLYLALRFFPVNTYVALGHKDCLALAWAQTEGREWAIFWALAIGGNLMILGVLAIAALVTYKLFWLALLLSPLMIITFVFGSFYLANFAYSLPAQTAALKKSAVAAGPAKKRSAAAKRPKKPVKKAAKKKKR